ncbi:MAG: phosphoribosylaminoimidazole-succinocarboxamide synthase, partial [uncultured bacterium (gcode 4)]
MTTEIVSDKEITTLPIALLLVWSNSDDPKVAECKNYLEEQGIFVFDDVKSAHRTPDALKDAVGDYPELSSDIQWLLVGTTAKVSVVIGAAGWAAHLPGAIATHNPFIPVIALPVWSATFAKVFGDAYAALNATISMHDMPPEVPNGLAPNSLIAGKMAEKIIRLDLPEWYNKVSVPEEENMNPLFLESLWVEVDEESPIQIVLQDIDDKNFSLKDSDKICIIIPTATPVPLWYQRDIWTVFNRLNAEGLYMGWQVEKINYTNALIFAAQLLASKGNETIKRNLIARRKNAHDKVCLIAEEREKQNATRLDQIIRLNSSWLWPTRKAMNFTRGDEGLESLGYVRFYTGKNADLYIIPQMEPIQILMVRTDRKSVFNIPLDLEIEWSWAIQNQISLLGSWFAEKHGIPTAMRKLPENIPQELRDRCQAIELCRQLEVEVDGQQQGMELIFRNYITGSLLEKHQAGENPYEISLPEWLKEWDDIRDVDGNAVFTPTDKTKDDNPIPARIVREAYPEIVNKLQTLFR